MIEKKLQIQFGPVEIKVFYLWVFLGIVPYIAPAFGARFIVSPWWMDNCQTIAYLFGIFSGAFFLWYSSRRVELKRLDEPNSITLFFLGFPFFNFFIGWTFVMASVPMALAIVVGGYTHLSLTVSNPSVSHRHCRNGVSFEGTTFFFNDTCNVPSSVLEQLKQGDTVNATGWGTSLGVFNASLKDG